MRRAAGLTQERLAELAETSRVQINRLEKGKRRLTREWADRLAPHLGVSPHEVMFTEAELASGSKEQRPAPIISSIQAGNWNPSVDPYPPGEGEDVIWTDRPVSARAFALRITGDSMEPDFGDGDIVVIDPDVEPLSGDFVAAKRDAEEDATFKEYRLRSHDPAAPSFELIPLNRAYPTITADPANPARIIGTMVEHRRYRRRRAA